MYMKYMHWSADVRVSNGGYHKNLTCQLNETYVINNANVIKNDIYVA